MSLNPEQIVTLLNGKYNSLGYIFEKTDDEKNIVGFVDNKKFDSIIAVIDPTETEMYNLINHIDNELN